ATAWTAGICIWTAPPLAWTRKLLCRGPALRACGRVRPPPTSACRPRSSAATLPTSQASIYRK
ncbi:unnamed protein product, partial [Effrenium voratum]